MVIAKVLEIERSHRKFIVKLTPKINRRKMKHIALFPVKLELFTFKLLSKM